MSRRYQVTIPADAPPWARRVQAPLSDAFNRIGADMTSLRDDVADIETPTITGSRSSATVAVVEALLTALAARGLIIDDTSP